MGGSLSCDCGPRYWDDVATAIDTSEVVDGHKLGVGVPFTVKGAGPSGPPYMDKYKQDGVGRNVVVGASGMQGWRPSMEDQHLMLHGIGPLSSSWLFAVFDGHGGAFTATFAAQQLPRKVAAALESLGQSPADLETSLAALQDVLYHSALLVDHELSTCKGVAHSGSTANYALLTPRHLLVANIGDSRAVLCSGGKAIPMSYDHKPSNVRQERYHLKLGRHWRLLE